MLIEVIELLLQQVDLVLSTHDILALLGLFFGLAGHRCKVVVDHVEQAGVLPRGMN